jgi:hypothetical protein
MGQRTALFALGLALCCLAPGAGAQDEDVRTVPVNDVKNPEMKSYRAVVKGLDMFDSEHALAPAVPELRFRIRTNAGNSKCIGQCAGASDGLPDAGDQGFALRIAGDNASITVPVSPDGVFTVPRSEAAYDDKADLILNRKKGSYRISADVRTPGLPDNVRRLGDLRLECKVQLAIVKEEIPFWVIALANTVVLSSDWCMATFKGESAKFAYATDRDLLNATLTHGDRSQKLEGGKRRYSVPLGDRSWPDDALVQLDYAPH